MFLMPYLIVKARWVKQYGQSAKGLRVDWTDRGKLAMDALGYVIEDLGPESLIESDNFGGQSERLQPFT